MEEIYRRLAARLDEMPNGFPPAESGVELKILSKIFTPDEAEMHLKLKAMPETAEAIAERLGSPLPEISSFLDRMTEKGQIIRMVMGGRQIFMPMPFILYLSVLEILTFF